MKPNLSDILVCAECECGSATVRLLIDLIEVLEERVKKETSFINKNHLSETSTEIARVLILRYNELIGTE